MIAVSPHSGKIATYWPTKQNGQHIYKICILPAHGKHVCNGTKNVRRFVLLPIKTLLTFLARRIFILRTLFSSNKACWGSDSKERISVRVPGEGGSPVTLDRFPQRSWQQDRGTHIFAANMYMFVAAKMYPYYCGKNVAIFSQQTCTICSGQNVQF